MSSKSANKSHRTGESHSPPSITQSTKPGANSSTKDSSFHGKFLPSPSIPKPTGKNVPSKSLSSSKVKDRSSLHYSRDSKSLPATKQTTRTRKDSSSSKSSDSDSMSDSESDLSGSSSLSSSSDSNSSHSSYTSSLSNFDDKPLPGNEKNTYTPGINAQTNSEVEKSKEMKNPASSQRENKDTRKSSSNINSPSRSQTRSKKESRSLEDPKNLSPRTTKIHVGNLTRNILRSHLQEVFSNYGKIKSLDFPLDTISGFNQGYSYIDFYNSQSATDALNYMDEGYLDGQVISVQITHPLKRVEHSYRSSGRKSPKYSPRKRNWSPPSRRNVGSEFRRGRSPIMRAPARFQRRRREQSLSSSLSRSRSRSPSTSRHRKKHYSKHTSIEKYRKYSRSISHSPSRKSRYRNSRRVSTSSSYTSSSDSH